jgi:hypothetical protein
MPIDITRLEHAYLLARNLSRDPQIPDADRVCCHVIGILIREACGDAAATWGTSGAAAAFAHSTE